MLVHAKARSAGRGVCSNTSTASLAPKRAVYTPAMCENRAVGDRGVDADAEAEAEAESFESGLLLASVEAVGAAGGWSRIVIVAMHYR